MVEDVIADRNRERGKHRAPCPEYGRAGLPLWRALTPPPPHEQRDGEHGEHDPDRALPLQQAVGEAVVARDLECVVWAVGTDLRARIGKQKPGELDHGDERDRRRDQAEVELALQAPAREREHEVDEAEQVHRLERRPQRERQRRIRIGEEGGEPGKADEDHHSPEPVLRPLLPRNQTATDVGPADDEREHCRSCRRARLTIAPEDEQGRPYSRPKSEQRNEKVTPHQPAEEIVHPRPEAVQRQHLPIPSRGHG